MLVVLTGHVVVISTLTDPDPASDMPLLCVPRRSTRSHLALTRTAQTMRLVWRHDVPHDALQGDAVLPLCVMQSMLHAGLTPLRATAARSPSRWCCRHKCNPKIAHILPAHPEAESTVLFMRRLLRPSAWNSIMPESLFTLHPTFALGTSA